LEEASNRKCVQAMGMEGEELNPHQKRAAEERRGRQIEMIYCPACRRYRWAIVQGGIQQCLECGNLVDKKNAGASTCGKGQ